MSIIAKTVKSFVLTAVAISVPIAAEAETQKFQRDGVSYEYTTSLKHGRQVLTGTADHVPFRFVVRGRYVTGQYNYHEVSFTQPAAKRASGSVAVR